MTVSVMMMSMRMIMAMTMAVMCVAECRQADDVDDKSENTYGKEFI